MNEIPSDWLYGLIGGILIGLASSIYLIFNGRIAGISGILGSMITLPDLTSRITPVFFLLGLIIAPAVLTQTYFAPDITVTENITLLILGGLIVGFGTRLGNGCTSGHGVCGMSRFSVRAITATCIFMGFAGATVYVTRHMIGL